MSEKDRPATSTLALYPQPLSPGRQLEAGGVQRKSPPGMPVPAQQTLDAQSRGVGEMVGSGVLPANRLGGCPVWVWGSRLGNTVERTLPVSVH